MTWEGYTRSGLVLVCVLMLAWDALIISIGQYDATISVIVYRESKKHPLIPFLLGMVIGHLLWQIFEHPETRVASQYIIPTLVPGACM